MRQQKNLGQIFLKDRNILDKLIKEANVTDSETILEIGCGDLILSEALAKNASHLVIIELSPEYVENAHSGLSDYSNVTIVQADVLKSKFSPVESDSFRIVANIPYQISAKLIKLMIEDRNRLGRSLLMVQKEFASKLVASPGSKDYTSLTLYSQFYLEFRKCFNISRQCFSPIPKVDSAIIEIIPRSKPLYEVDEDLFFTIIRSAFWGRRKALINCLSKGPYLRISRDKLTALPFFEDRLNVRGEIFGLSDFFDLYTQIKGLEN